MTEVFWLVKTDADVSVGDLWLSTREREVQARLKAAPRIASWRLGRWTAKQLARHVLAGDTVEVIAASDGAPEVYVETTGRLAPLSLSLSHRAGEALCVMGFGSGGSLGALRLGCDIERIEARSRAFVTDYMTREERGFIEAEERDLRANLIWSAKESVLKATRTGLSRDPMELEVAPSRAEGHTWAPLLVRDVRSGEVWRGQWRRYGGSVLTIVADVEVHLVAV